MSGRGVRVVRGLAAAAVAVFMAAFSHAAAGGGAPGGAGLMLAIALSSVVCVVLAGRRLSLWALTTSVLISQFALHLLFAVGAGSGVTLTESAHHGHVTMTVTGATDVLSTAAHPGHDSGWMWVAHACAAVLTIALLHRGERTLRALLALSVLVRERVAALWVRARLGHAFAFARALPAACTAAAAHLHRHRRRSRAGEAGPVDRLRDLLVVTSTLRHRGPPAALAARL